MGILQTWNDVLESLGAVAGNLYQQTHWFRQLNEPILDFSCNLWAKYPKGIPFNPYTRGFVQSICAQAGKPIPGEPVVPFIGGQCEDVFYEITFICEVTFNEQTTTNTYICNGYGPLTEVSVKFSPPEYFGVFCCYVKGKPGVYIPEGVDGRPIGGVGFTVVILSTTISRVDNLPDNCGNPPGDLPDNPPRDPNDFHRSFDIDVIDPNGNILKDVTIDIDLNIDSDLNFPLNILVGGLKIFIDLSGLESEEEDTKKPEVPPPSSPLLDPIKRPELQSDLVPTKNILVWVKLNVTKMPRNAKSQSGVNAPDVFYCGWFEFLLENSTLNRVPVHFSKSGFFAPPGATGYAYTLYEGFKGQATYYTKKLPVVPPASPIS